MGAFQRFLAEYNMPLTNQVDPSSDPFGTRYGGAPAGVEERTGYITTGLTQGQRDELRRWTDWNPGGAALFEYLDETYLVNGEQRNVAQLFYQLASGQITQTDLVRDLTFGTNEAGVHTNGATWFEEFKQKYNSYYDNSIGAAVEDGATLQQKIDSALAIIQDRVRTLGLALSEAEIVDVATLAVQSKWNDSQVIDRLLTNYDLTLAKPGDLTTAQSDVMTLANQFLVPITEQQAMDYAKRMYLGEISSETIADQFKRQLVSDMPFLQSSLDRGLTPADIFGSATAFAANELEIDAGSIDLREPKWRDMFISTDDKGESRVATLSEIRTRVRNTPEWSRTSAAKESASNLAGAIAQLFGRSGF